MSKSGKLSKTQRQFPEEATIVGPPPDVEPTLVGAPLGWAPEPEQPTAVQVEAPIPPPAAVEAPSEPVAEPRPAVEVEVRTVKNPATLARRQLPTYELWTKNRVYNLDATMSCIEVIDQGPGMDAATLARAGEPFSSTRAGSGMGLGLYFARAVAEHVGGSLVLTSEPGTGTTATLCLPRST